MTEKFRLIVLASGSGTHLQALLEACENDTLDAEVVVVISDRQDSFALHHAMELGIPALYRPWGPYNKAGKLPFTYDLDMAALVGLYNPDLIVLAGWTRPLTMAFLENFRGMVIGVRPTLPGIAFETDPIAHAFESFKQGALNYTGVTAHYLLHEKDDQGPLITKQIVPIYPEDDLETLKARVQEIEQKVLIGAIAKVLEEFLDNN